MAFTCKRCLPRGSKWLADLRGSRGPCECCGTVSNCVDWGGGWEPNSGTSDTGAVESLDACRYDEFDKDEDG